MLYYIFFTVYVVLYVVWYIFYYILSIYTPVYYSSQKNEYIDIYIYQYIYIEIYIIKMLTKRGLYGGNMLLTSHGYKTIREVYEGYYKYMLVICGKYSEPNIQVWDGSAFSNIIIMYTGKTSKLAQIDTNTGVSVYASANYDIPTIKNRSDDVAESYKYYESPFVKLLPETKIVLLSDIIRDKPTKHYERIKQVILGYQDSIESVDLIRQTYRECNHDNLYTNTAYAEILLTMINNRGVIINNEYIEIKSQSYDLLLLCKLYLSLLGASGYITTGDDTDMMDYIVDNNLHKLTGKSIRRQNFSDANRDTIICRDHGIKKTTKFLATYTMVIDILSAIVLYCKLCDTGTIGKLVRQYNANEEKRIGEITFTGSTVSAITLDNRKFTNINMALNLIMLANIYNDESSLTVYTAPKFTSATDLFDTYVIKIDTGKLGYWNGITMFDSADVKRFKDGTISPITIDIGKLFVDLYLIEHKASQYMLQKGMIIIDRDSMMEFVLKYKNDNGVKKICENVIQWKNY